MFTGTGSRAIIHAFSNFLNRNGPGQYDLPSMIGGNSFAGNKRNHPSWSLSSKTNLPAHKEYSVVII
jgi:hypothetical protein